MSFTVDAIVGDPSLRTRYLGGSSGGGREVRWAHTCELPDPWSWLGEGDLLLTGGLAFPSDERGQVEFISRLAEAGIVGIALAEGLGSPKVTQGAVAYAEQSGFAILETAYNVPFVTVARTVALANAEASSGRLVRTQRLYDILRRSHSSAEIRDGLLDLLAAEVRTTVDVLSIRTGARLLPSGSAVVDGLAEQLVRLVQRSSGRLPGFSRLEVGEVTYVVLPVGEGTRAALVVSSQATDGSAPDLVLLQHVATIADVEVERRSALEARRRVRGTRLLQQLVDGTVTTEYALSELVDLDLGEGPWRALLWSSSALAGDLEELLFDAGVPMLHLRGEHGNLVIVASRTPDDAFASPALLASAYAGASRLINNLSRVPDAVREARWAKEVAGGTAGRRVTYGERTAPFFPRSMAEAEEVVAQVLGTLIAYDQENDTELVRTLEVFFDSNRSWQEGSRQLGIHRQTLVYRIRRIEQLTDRDLNQFGSQAELYFAIRTWRMLKSN